MPLVNCPHCGRAVEWSAAAPFRPFCSERCRLLDLGDWMAGKHAIAGDEATPGELSPGEHPPADLQPDDDHSGRPH